MSEPLLVGRAAPDPVTDPDSRARSAPDLITLDGVSLWFGPDQQIRIVEELDLRVEPGQWHCIAGRSGSGKTSLLRVVAGLAEPSDGRVLWAGTSISGWSEDRRALYRRATIGYVDQVSAVIPGFSTLENVLMPAVPGRRAHALTDRAANLLGQLGLGDRTTLRAELLSGGERQRAALARALLLEPPLLVLDEPTASQDRATADRVIDQLAALVDAGTAVICASHDPHVVAAAQTVTRLE
ncbi:ABC transporter ATP-binding protein [Ornithinimicrobium avium]|uniref:ATP-binding cassette domain-containing protein n=1 Tax=Ornithinimicrobium avium TaxID=2283195 RepID=A0A345NJ02_9MICO|nr:ATP-binding cassette domain-containing protein [Ornithinimicrobium avium]AXH95010.1 ATP-binding cassette domain-containing protein [Ornithinimicrobium avium]